MSDVTEWISERRRIHDAATEGPWEWEPEIVTQAKFRQAKVSSVGWAGYPVNDAVEMSVPATTADAIAVVDAHDTLPALLTAVEKVLELHKPHKASSFWGNATYCSHCQDEDAGGAVEWPCGTVRAIEGAINE